MTFKEASEPVEGLEGEQVWVAQTVRAGWTSESVGDLHTLLLLQGYLERGLPEATSDFLGSHVFTGPVIVAAHSLVREFF